NLRFVSSGESNATQNLALRETEAEAKVFPMDFAPRAAPYPPERPSLMGRPFFHSRTLFSGTSAVLSFWYKHFDEGWSGCGKTKNRLDHRAFHDDSIWCPSGGCCFGGEPWYTSSRLLAHKRTWRG